MARLIVESSCREFLLGFAERERHHKFTRVSMESLTPRLENALREEMRRIVREQPSSGKTIK